MTDFKVNPSDSINNINKLNFCCRHLLKFEPEHNFYDIIIQFHGMYKCTFHLIED